MKQGECFQGRPNYRKFRQGPFPRYMPIYHQAHLPTKFSLGRAITKHWPREAYHWRASRASATRMVEKGRPGDGDWIMVIGQVRSEMVYDDRGAHSNLWDVVLVPVKRATKWAERYNCQRLDSDWGGEDCYIGFTPDIWLGNTGWHYIAYDPCA